MSATASVALTTDTAAACACWTALVRPGDVHEVRIPKSRKGPRRFFGTVSGYFDNADDFATALTGLTGYDAEGVYLTLNPVNPDLLARAANRLKDNARETTGDGDVLRRANLLIDVDPVRPSGISATDAERDAALGVRDDVQAFLTDAMGWPAPTAVVESGNGGGLVYRIDLPNDAESDTLARRVLAGLAAAFDTPDVSIDTAIANAARLVKVAGTVAAKGDDVPERPWRLAAATYPQDATVVPRDALARVADLAPDPAPMRPLALADGHSTTRDWDIRDVLRRNGMTFKERTTSYATIFVLDRCLTSADHADGASIIEMASGALAYRCLHSRCSHQRWADVRPILGLEAGGTGPRVSVNGHHAHAALAPSPAGVRPSGDIWPSLDEDALHGLAGDIVRAIDPHTEADRVAVLAHVLVMFGSAIGRAPHVRVGEVRHGTNENVVLVGQSSKARKGTAEAGPRRIVGEADPHWARGRILSGLSSGEGVIWAVRDPIEKQEPIKEKGLITGYQTVILDPGIEDKRLLVVEEEFGATLKVAGREGNTLTAILRQAWDGKDLRAMTKNSPAAATAPHVSVIGHITRDELRRDLSSTEAANGFGNRHLWLAVRRSKVLPEGGRLPDDVAGELTRRVQQAIDAARRRSEVKRNDEARELWAEVYPDLSEGKPGLFGAVTSRAEAHTLRLSLLFALLDQAPKITAEHLIAALALWDYCEASARHIFGDATGDPVADRILAALRTHGPSAQNDLVNLFERHVNATRMSRALELLVTAGLITSSSEETGGRPRTVWLAT
jgi:hypothetical protein